MKSRKARLLSLDAATRKNGRSPANSLSLLDVSTLFFFFDLCWIEQTEKYFQNLSRPQFLHAAAACPQNAMFHAQLAYASASALHRGAAALIP
jgi:hypothetical protein